MEDPILGSVIKTVAYMKAPKKTFIARHPLRAVSAVAGVKLLKAALPENAGRKALGLALLLSVPAVALLRRDENRAPA